MRKRCKRRVREASEPALTFLHSTPEIGLAERLAIQALRGGWSDYENCYRVLADCHGILTIARKRKDDDSMEGVLKASSIALLNIFDRMQATGKVGATGDELQAMEMLVDTADDYWKRQSYAAFINAITALKAVRKRQIAERKAA